MPILTFSHLRSRLPNQLIFRDKRSFESLYDFANRKLQEQSRNFQNRTSYDIFLSHSFKDAPVILMLALLLEQQGTTVYVDWLDDPNLDRTNVTAENAKIIRERMKTCKSLLYAISSNSVQSSWVQWELGLGDGQKNGKVAIVPIYQDQEFSPNFFKQEYLGLYPYIDNVDDLLYVNGKSRMTIASWLANPNPLQVLMYG